MVAQAFRQFNPIGSILSGTQVRNADTVNELNQLALTNQQRASDERNAFIDQLRVLAEENPDSEFARLFAASPELATQFSGEQRGRQASEIAGREFQAEERTRIATIANRAATGILNSANPRQAALLFEDELKNENIIAPDTDFESLTDEQIIASAAQLQEGTAPFIEQPNLRNPIPGIDPETGELAFFNPTEQGGLNRVEGATPPPPRAGVSVSSTPGGGFSVTVGGPSGDQATASLTKPTANNLQESFTNAQAGLDRLISIQQAFRPEFLTFQGQLAGGLQRLRSRAGAELSPEQRQFLTEYGNFTTRVINNVNLYIKEITGAQMSEPEAQRIRAGVPNEDDDPVTFKAKMDASFKDIARVRARAAHALKNGLNLTPGELEKQLPLAAIDQIVEARGAEIIQELTASGMDPQTARAQANQLVRQEFGLP